MTTKQDTPIKPHNKNNASSFHPGVKSKMPSNTSNEDLMNVLVSFKNEILASNKNLSDSQATQFKELKNNLKQVSSQITELKAENSRLHDDLETLKGKMAVLESTSSSLQSHEVVSQVLYETFERERRSTNLIAYGIPESTSSSIPERVTHDKSKIEGILGPIGNSILSLCKFIRLGKTRTDASRPVKITCDTKEAAMRLFTDYGKAKRSGTSFPVGFRLSRDKTHLERKHVRSCLDEIDNRTKNGEVGLKIVFHNGLPRISSNVSKNLDTQQKSTAT